MHRLYILTAFLFFYANISDAANRTAEEILAAGNNQQIGYEIAKEIDLRDQGFGDSEVQINLTLRNAHGQESFRTLRNKTFEIVDNSLGDKSLIVFDTPRDIKGTAFLTFSKILEPDDQWLYLPALKRVKRISSKNKSGPFMGSEFAYEDISSSEIDKYEYEYLRAEPCESISASCLVMKRVPLYEHSGYTKQLVWVDRLHFVPSKIDYYDRKDALLKTQKLTKYKKYLDRFWRAQELMMHNHQTGKSTLLESKGYKFQNGFQESDFTKNKLKQVK